MPSYKLFYFPAKGTAEPTRLLFAYKGIQYEDIRLAPGEAWAEQKPNMPFGTMPVLEEDGEKLGGSLVILRYLAEKPEINLAGSNARENAWLANISDFINDFARALYDIFFEGDEAVKKQRREKMTAETGPKYLGKLNEMAANGGYLCCGRLTWPDLQLFPILELLSAFLPDLLAPFSNLAKLKANIEGEPNIAKWIAERPVTEH